MDPNVDTDAEDDDIDPLAPLEAGDLPEDEISEDDTLDDRDLDLLSAEERAAFDAEEGAEIADGGENGEAATDDPTPAASEPATAAQPAAQTVPDIDIAALKATLDGVDQGIATAKTEYEDGELTLDELTAKVIEINTRGATAKAALAQHESAFEAVKTAFHTEVRSYFGQYADLKSEAHIEGFDQYVRHVTGSPRFDHLTSRQKLETAHRMYAAEAEAAGTPILLPKGKAAATTPAAEADPKPKGKTPLAEQAKPPMTLARVPAVTMTGPSEGRYSSIQARIEAAGNDAAKIEAIMGAMTNDEREAFASMDV